MLPSSNCPSSRFDLVMDQVLGGQRPLGVLALLPQPLHGALVPGNVNARSALELRHEVAHEVLVEVLPLPPGGCPPLL